MSLLHILAREFAAMLSAGCLLCDQPCESGDLPGLCRLCEGSLPVNRSACRRCATPLQPLTDAACNAPSVCGSCLREPPPYTHTVAPLLYQGAPRIWVRQLKSRFGFAEGRLLGQILARAVLDHRDGDRDSLPQPDVVLPVPLAPLRLARRGHNQAISLALPVARQLRAPLRRIAVRRIRSTPPQRKLDRAGRLANLQHAFASRQWRGETVAIVDDVMTTGATVTALTETLLDAGAGRVMVFCAARTVATHSGSASLAGVADKLRP